MSDGLDIAFFGSSLVSAYWNGAATYYRGILRALAARGHRITFYEPDAYDRQAHRDIPDPPWAEVIVYAADDEAGVRWALAEASRVDLVVKASGVGVFDELLEAAIVDLARHDGTRPLRAFWDVDAPATLERAEKNPADPFRAFIPGYDVVFTYGGGPPVVAGYAALGSRLCVPVYNGLDADVHRPAPPDPRFTGDLGFLGNRLPDRERRVEEFFLAPAAALPALAFVLGGSGWNDKPVPDNVRAIGHVYTADHNAFNASSRAVLNVNRDSMARVGHSPATRVFEAAGAAACVITDAFIGVERFFAPGEEILVARDGGEVAQILAALTPARAAAIGEAARRRALAEHTYDRRATLVEAVLADLSRGRRAAPVSLGAGAAG
ncbi:MAG TPA: glycosyltransferase [Polyangia bacterium]|nr:glycosyltransferase [Polyangia bacterium]